MVMIVLVFAGYAYLKRPTDEKTATPSPNTDFSGEDNPEVRTLEGDLLGRGYKQKVQVSVGERKSKIEVYDKDELVASNVFTFGIIKPTGEYTIIKLDDKKPREYIRWDQYVGPHQVETNILAAKDKVIRPIIAADYDINAWYAPFWASRDNVSIGDLDEDGKSEIIEYVDEFPPDAPRLVDANLEKITRDEFPDDKEEDMWKIVSRENSGIGRGNKVVWNIYTMMDEDGPLYRKVTKDEYVLMTDKLFKAMDIVNANLDKPVKVLSRYDLSQDSIDFNIFVRDFWTQGYPFTQPFEENVN